MVNSLPSAARCKVFADDVKAYITIKGETCITNFSVLLEAIHTWSERWQLPLSIPKCGWMLIFNRIDTRSLSFNIAGHALTQFNEVKDLWALFSSQPCFSSHLSCIVSKANQRADVLCKSFTSSSCDALIMAFKTYVIPVLDYCSPVWSPSQVTDIIKLESVQRAFTRYLKSCAKLSDKERLIKCELISLEKRRLISDLVLFDKIIHKMVDNLTLSLEIQSLSNRCYKRSQSIMLFIRAPE